MRFKLYDDAKLFHGDVRGVLLRNEAQNLIPLGNAIIGAEGGDASGWRNPAGWLMATVSDGSGIRLTAVMTPPHNLTLYATDNIIDCEAVDRLISGIGETDFIISGVMTDNGFAEAFAKKYCVSKNLNYKINKRQRIYELTEISEEIKITGSLRPAKENDLAFLPYWDCGFSNECFGTNNLAGSDAEYVRRLISTGTLYILEDGGTPVSMARRNREMQTVCGVGYVYTPPYFRNKGYATSCVAGVSRIVLERGFEKCVLYTDLANPTSNSIYQKIGYKPICDSLEIRFE